MTHTKQVGRRKFLRAAAAGAVAGAAVGCNRSTGPYRFLTLREATTLEAICGQIIPEDQAPGAAQASAIQYIDRQLTGKFKDQAKVYRAGLAAIDAMAGGDFATLPAEQQIAILHRVERDDSMRQFFDAVIAHSMQGFYGNPRHGGNRDFVSWQMLGIPVTQVRGRDRYEFPQGARREKS